MIAFAKSAASSRLEANQVEFHPLLDQSRLLKAASDTGIPPSADSSAAHGEAFRYPLFAAIGAGDGESAGNVALRWILQKGVMVATMSTKAENIRASLEVMDFSLSSIDMARIDGLAAATNQRIVGTDLVPLAPDVD
jgi:2,5-diketo-D-gluconate reductase B